jgi:hypothetical protein
MCVHKNLFYARRKMTAFAAPITPKVKDVQQQRVRIHYIELHARQVINV